MTDTVPPTPDEGPGLSPKLPGNAKDPTSPSPPTSLESHAGSAEPAMQSETEQESEPASETIGQEEPDRPESTAEASEATAPPGERNSPQPTDKTERESNRQYIDIAQADTPITVAKVEGDLNFGGKRSDFKDPTIHFDPFQKDVRRFRCADLKRWVDALNRDRIIILTCPDERIALAAACALFQHNELARLEHRQLVLDRFKPRKNEDPTDEQDLDRLPSLDLFAERSVGDDEESLTFIDVNSLQFLETMFPRRRAHTSSIHTGLREQKNRLVCVISESSAYDSFAQRRSESKFFWERIPFLEMLLDRHFSDEKAHELAAQIARQREEGQWGELSEHGFYRAIRTHLQEGTLEIESRRLLAGAVPEKAVKAADLFEDAADLGKAVLFVAAFFRDLSPDEFEQVLRLLLKGEKSEEEVDSKIVTKKGKVKTVTLREEKPLEEIWSSQADSCLQAAHLKTYRSDNGLEIVDFSFPYLRQDLINHLRRSRPIFLRRQFARIQESGLLFKPGASHKQVQQTISFSVEMALSDPVQFEKWVTNVVVSSTSKLRPPAEGPEQHLRQAIQQFRVQILRGHIFSRLGDLFREMAKHRQLRAVIHQCPETLIFRDEHYAALHLVLAIAGRFRFAPEFDAVRLIRRLIDAGGPSGVGQIAYSVLLMQARQMGLLLYDLLEPISKWLPEPDRKKVLRPSHRYSLQLLLDLSRDTVRNFPWEDLGKWPSRYALFRPFQGDNGQNQQRLEMVVSWLFHPLLPENLSVQGADPETGIWWVRADMLEAWYEILVGEESRQRSAAAVQFADSLLRRVVSSTSPEDHVKLLSRWRSRRKFYHSEISRFSIHEDETRRRLREMIKLSLELERRFQQLKRTFSKPRMDSQK